MLGGGTVTKLIIAPEAGADLVNAYHWYEKRRVGLGEEFLSCVDVCLQGVCRQPELHAKVRENYRRVLVRRFPFAVFYEHEDGVVSVYGIFHTTRDPAAWQQRLP